MRQLVMIYDSDKSAGLTKREDEDKIRRYINEQKKTPPPNTYHVDR